MTVVSTTRKSNSTHSINVLHNYHHPSRRRMPTALQISIFCNIGLSLFVILLLWQQNSLLTVRTGNEHISSTLEERLKMKPLNNRTSISEISNTVPTNMIHRDYVFHGGHPVSSDLPGSCYCSGIDMYCMCNPSLAIDIVIISGHDHLWFVRRRDTNQLAIVGGFVDIGETVLDAVHRELYEETGLIINSNNSSAARSQSYQYTEPVFFGIYSDPRRDNRRHTVSVAFAIHFDGHERPVASDDVKNVERIHISNVNQLTLFADQKTIVLDYLRLYYDTKTKTSADFVTSYDDFAPDIHRSVCVPFDSV